MASIAYSTDGDWKIMTITGSVYNGTFADALTNVPGGFNPTTDNLKIIGGVSNQGSTWNDFQLSYSNFTSNPSKIHIENIQFVTTSVNGYALYTKVTQVTMKDVTIDGYSGGAGRWTETSGGALRIRNANYGNTYNSTNPTLDNVTVTNCCRGPRIQDTNGFYGKNCHIVQAAGAPCSVSDNALYFAAGSYTSSSGCTNCVFDGCDVTNAGQAAFQSIGGSSNSFINCTVDGSRAAAVSCYNTNGTITVDNCSFTNANTDTYTTTPWGGALDNFNGAAVGMSVAVTDTDGLLLVTNSTFISGGGSVFYWNGNGTLTENNNTITLSGFPDGYGSVTPVPICFPKGTPVLTNLGEVAIEKLNPDKHTIRGNEIVAITQSRPLQKHIVCFEKDSLSKNVPSQQTLCSMEHKVFYKGEMTKARNLVDLCENVTLVPYNGETLFNVLLKKHDKMMINNLICETLHPDNIAAKISTMKDGQKKNKAIRELTKIIKENNVPEYQKLYASL